MYIKAVSVTELERVETLLAQGLDLGLLSAVFEKRQLVKRKNRIDMSAPQHFQENLNSINVTRL